MTNTAWPQPLNQKTPQHRIGLMRQLDSETGRQIMRLLRTVVHSEGITALVATHDPALMDLADDMLELDDGQLVTG